MFYNTLEQFNIIMMEIAKIIKNNISLDILRQNIFPDRPEEAAMFGCKSLSTVEQNFSSVSERTFKIDKQVTINDFPSNNYSSDEPSSKLDEDLN